MGRYDCDFFQSMLFVVGDAELHERRDCVSMKLPAPKVHAWHNGDDAAVEVQWWRVDYGFRQHFCTIIF